MVSQSVSQSCRGMHVMGEEPACDHAGVMLAELVLTRCGFVRLWPKVSNPKHQLWVPPCMKAGCIVYNPFLPVLQFLTCPTPYLLFHLPHTQMPGMNGYEVCKELRKHYSSALLPIIMVSAKSADEDVVQVRVCCLSGRRPVVLLYALSCLCQQGPTEKHATQSMYSSMVVRHA